MDNIQKSWSPNMTLKRDTIFSQSTSVTLNSCVRGSLWVIKEILEKSFWKSYKLGHSGASLPSGMNLNEWIPSTATSVRMNFTSDDSGTRPGFEVLVGCPVTPTTETATVVPIAASFEASGDYDDSDFADSFTTQAPTTISKWLCRSVQKTVKVGTFSTSNPYNNSMDMQENFTCTGGQNPEIMITRFDTESQYDFLTINFGDTEFMRKW